MSEETRYEINPLVTPEEVAGIFRAAGLRRPVEDMPRIAEMVEKANFNIGAYQGRRLVGFGRALTDFCYICYLSCLAVHPDCQRRGIGKGIIDLYRQELGEQVTILLLSAPEAMDYYGKIGFQKVGNAWYLPRKG